MLTIVNGSELLSVALTISFNGSLAGNRVNAWLSRNSRDNALKEFEDQEVPEV